MKRLGMWCVVTMALLSFSCGTKPVGAVVADTPRGDWSEPVTIVYNNDDSLAVRDLSIVARIENGWVEKSLAVQIRCTAPSGGYFESEVVLTNSEGRHSGGSFTRLRGEWIREAQLSERGDYLFTITPIEGSLSGVWTVGVEIEHSTAKE